jgi:hypothetical protein
VPFRFVNSASSLVTLSMLGATSMDGVDPVRVPRVSPGSVAIDARHDAVEWARATTQELSDGSELRLQHDGTHLYLAIASSRPGFPSLCGARGNQVRVFHASAALGAVSYSASGTEWTTRDTAFVYGMRTTDSTQAAHQERRAYLAEHGWVSTTFRMGGGRSIEMQIALAELDSVPRIALAFFVPEGNDRWSILPWPAALPANDACLEPRLVRGYVPPRLRFQSGAFAELALEP